MICYNFQHALSLFQLFNLCEKAGELLLCSIPGLKFLSIFNQAFVISGCILKLLLNLYETQQLIQNDCRAIDWKF